MARKQLGYVYFVLCRATNLVKIGWSLYHPDVRLRQFRLGSGAPLERFGYIRDVRSLERRLHNRFEHLREHGEWFRLEADLCEYIEENTEPWQVKSRSSKANRTMFRISREKYDEIMSGLVNEWTRVYYCRRPGSLPVEDENFFEFCRRKGVRPRRSDRTMVKVVNGKPVLYAYEYDDERDG